MYEKKIIPHGPGKHVLVPGLAPGSKERHQAGPLAAPHGNVEVPLDRRNFTTERFPKESYANRVLRERYGLSRVIAGIVASELGWGGP